MTNQTVKSINLGEESEYIPYIIIKGEKYVNENYKPIESIKFPESIAVVETEDTIYVNNMHCYEK